MSLLRNLVFEANPGTESQQPLSSRLLTAWAGRFDRNNVWKSIFPCPSEANLVTAHLTNIFRDVASTINSEVSHAKTLLR
jgi:hypothetical protein